MALNEDEPRGTEELDRILSEEIDGYKSPSEEELERWLDAAPDP